MKNRIRVAVLLFKKDKILLVKHIDPTTKFEWWVPPGRGLEGKETLFECAKRESYEETGLKIKVQQLTYVRQFISFETEQNNIELFFTGKIVSGTETMNNLKGLSDECFIKDLRYFSQKELQKINLFPEELKNQIWKDKKAGFSTVKFLGIQSDKKQTSPK